MLDIMICVHVISDDTSTCQCYLSTHAVLQLQTLYTYVYAFSICIHNYICVYVHVLLHASIHKTQSRQDTDTFNIALYTLCKSRLYDFKGDSYV